MITVPRYEDQSRDPRFRKHWDLMIKVLRPSDRLEMGALAGIDPDSDGLARARRLGVPSFAGGIDDLMRRSGIDDVCILFDATSAKAHTRHSEIARATAYPWSTSRPPRRRVCGPGRQHGQHFDSPDLSMVSCGGQATIPIIAAVSRIASVHYAEIVCSIASKSAGPGTRANIDEFTQTTARAIEIVGGARHGKAVIVLNPAEPPIIMRNTVFCLSDEADTTAIARSIEEMADPVCGYVPGYRLKQQVQFDRIGPINQCLCTASEPSPVSRFP